MDQLAPGSLASIRQVRIGGLRIAVLDTAATADLMIAQSGLRLGFPLFFTSANGEVLSRCDSDPYVADLFEAAHLISADGEPLVRASRLFTHDPLPERVATTDLFHEVARRAEIAGRSFYFFGASAAENKAAVDRVRQLYPRLIIAGASHGYLQGDALRDKLKEIDAAAPDILWLALGVPREQIFVRHFSCALTNVGLIKTSGGLFNFLSGSRRRAPAWMQRGSLEWAWRTALEPRRLFWRYATTNPHAIFLMMTRSG